MIYRPTEQGTWQKVEVRGPGSSMQWQACFEVFKTAAIMLDVADAGTFEQYEAKIERLAKEFLVGTDRSMAWGLLVQVEDRVRDRFATTMLGRAERGQKEGDPEFRILTPKKPWDWILHWPSGPQGDFHYWNDQ